MTSNEDFVVDMKEIGGNGASYNPEFLKISCEFLKRVLEKRKFMEIRKSRNLKEI